MLGCGSRARRHQRGKHRRQARPVRMRRLPSEQVTAKLARSFSDLPEPKVEIARGELAVIRFGASRTVTKRFKPMAKWSLTSLQLKVIKIGAGVVRHARAVAFRAG